MTGSHHDQFHAKKKAPRNLRGAPTQRTQRLELRSHYFTSGSLGVDHLGLAVADRNLARLHRLRDLADEIDVKQAVLERRAADLDVLGELEDALERACGDALVEHLALLLVGLGLLLALDRQGVLLRLDRNVGLAEA